MYLGRCVPAFLSGVLFNMKTMPLKEVLSRTCAYRIFLLIILGFRPWPTTVLFCVKKLLYYHSLTQAHGPQKDSLHFQGSPYDLLQNWAP